MKAQGHEISINSRYNIDSSKEETFFDNKIWINTKEAADFLRISVGSLRNAVYRKQIVARKFRRRLYFNRKELHRLLDNSLF